MDKMEKYGRNKHKDFVDSFQLSLILDSSLRIYEECRTRISLSSLAMIGPLGMIQDKQGLY